MKRTIHNIFIIIMALSVLTAAARVHKHYYCPRHNHQWLHASWQDDEGCRCYRHWVTDHVTCYCPRNDCPNS